VTRTKGRAAIVAFVIDAACALHAPSAAAAASTGEPGGVTAELAAGLSNAVVLSPFVDAFAPGVALLVGGIGWWLNARVALGLRSATYLLPATIAERDEPFLASFVGPSASFWLGRELLLGAAAGPALVWPAPFGASPYLRPNRGLAVSLRASRVVGGAAAGAVLLGVEVVPTFFDHGGLLIGTLVTAGLVWR
jgi:hypothetical protein